MSQSQNYSKTAILTGTPGQASYWLTKRLLKNRYRVIGTYRYSSTDFSKRFEGWEEILRDPNFVPTVLDLTDVSGIYNIVTKFKPEEIYNAGAASHVAESFDNPLMVFDVNTRPVIAFLEAIRLNSPDTRFVQFSTSEQWGSQYVLKKGVKYQNLGECAFEGNSPYAISKIAAFEAVKLARKSYGTFACNAMCYNYESKMRGINFLPRKVSRWLGSELFPFLDTPSVQDLDLSDREEITCDGRVLKKLRLGNLASHRDWSHAADVVRGVHMALTNDVADDYMFCSGTARTVEDFVKTAFKAVGIDNYMDYIYIDPAFFRPCEVEYLQGTYQKAKDILGWEPEISFDSLVGEMVDHDIALGRKCVSVHS